MNPFLVSQCFGVQTAQSLIYRLSLAIRYFLEPDISSPNLQDNGHIDKAHKFRVLFQGSHVLKLLELDHQGQLKSQHHVRCSPIYNFASKTIPSGQSQFNYIQFQELILGKQIALLVDVELINSSSKDPNCTQCRLGTIRVLVDQTYGSRSIFYFRRTKDMQPGFVEWPSSY